MVGHRPVWPGICVVALVHVIAGYGPQLSDCSPAQAESSSTPTAAHWKLEVHTASTREPWQLVCESHTGAWR
jgi:hypothetical protein